MKLHINTRNTRFEDLDLDGRDNNRSNKVWKREPKEKDFLRKKKDHRRSNPFKSFDRAF